MIPRDLAGITLLKFPTHVEEKHGFIVLQHRLRTELTSSAKLAVDGCHIPPGTMVFSLPPKPQTLVEVPPGALAWMKGEGQLSEEDIAFLKATSKPIE